MKKIYRQRLLSAVFSALMLISAVSFALPKVAPVSRADSAHGGIVQSKYFDDGTSIVQAENWIVGEGSSSSPVSDSGGKAFRINSLTGTAVASAVFEDGIEVEDHREIGIYVRSLSSGICTATLTVKHSGGVSEISKQVPTGEEYYMFASLPDNAETISEITFTASVPTEKNTDSNNVASAMISDVVLSTKEHSEAVEKYSAFAVEGIGKDSSVSSNTPVTAVPVIADDAIESGAARVALESSGGGLTFHFASDGDDYEVVGSAVITEGRSTYIFPVDRITADSAYKIEFTGTDRSSVTLKGVDFIPIRSHTAYDSLGSITKCTLADNTVSVAGNITRDTAVEYINGKLCLYEIPMWQDVQSVLAADPVDSISMSTTFSFSLPISEDYSAFTSYVVAIRDESGVYPLTDPIYPNTGYLPENEDPFAAISGISPENAFSAGVDKYIIDVDISTLFLEKSGLNSSVFTFDGYPYYPDRDILSQIGLKVQFLSAAGIDVIFRIDSGSRILSPGSAEDCRILAAAISYLTDHYKPYGFISNTDASGDGTISNRADRAASFARLISAVAGNGTAVYVLADVPYENETFVWLLAKYISAYPKADYRFVLPLASDSIGAVTACAADGGYTSPVTLSVDHGSDSPVPDIDTDTYSYILNVADGASFNLSYSGSETYAVADGVDEVPETSVTLWDFTNSYDSDGFTVPAGPTGIFTGADDALEEFLSIPACRSLKTVLGFDSHMIVAKPKAPMNLSACPKVRFLVSCNTDAPFAFDIVFISGDKRAVFAAEYDGSGIYSPVCDLSLTEIADRIDGIAIVLREGGPVELGIATVTAAGESLPEEIEGSLYITELPAVTEEAPTTEAVPQGQDPVVFNKVYLAAGALIVITIVIFAALSRKKQ